MCLSSVSTQSADVAIAVAAMIASAVGNSAYLHRSFAASIPISESRLTVVRFDIRIDSVLMSATFRPFVWRANL